MTRIARVGLAVLTAWVATCRGGAAEKPAAAPSPAQTTVITHANPAQAEVLIQAKKVTVLDVRTPGEYAAGHIAGATNLDSSANDFEQKLSALARDKTYMVHCASGRRSARSLETFRKLGFKEIVHLDGGLKAWGKAGKPVEKPEAL